MTTHEVPPDAAVPYDRTAVRPAWHELPGEVRGLVEARLGQAVAHVELAGGGFTRGFAGRIRGTDGGEAFVKAAGPEPAEIASSYRREAQVLQSLPTGMPVPALLWVAEVETVEGPWIVLASEVVAGLMPGAPWDEESLRRVLDAVHAASELATAAGLALEVDSLADDLAGEVDTLAYWPAVASGARVAPSVWAGQQAALLAELADAAASAVAGGAIVHTDVRADNVVLGEEGVWICDWNWVSRGAAWVDYVSLLAPARVQGVRVDRVVRGDALWEQASDRDVSRLLAWLAAFMLVQADAPSPPFASPWLRRHQRQAAAEYLAWLRDRLAPGL